MAPGPPDPSKPPKTKILIKFWAPGAPGVAKFFPSTEGCPPPRVGSRPEGTLDGKNLATPGAQNFIKILVFGGFEGSRGAWGHHQSTRDEKIPWGSYFREIWLEL